MRKKIGIMLCISMAVTMLSGCGINMEVPEEQESEVTELPPARAQDDFYRFINEETLADAEFKYGAMSSRLLSISSSRGSGTLPDAIISRIF